MKEIIVTKEKDWLVFKYDLFGVAFEKSSRAGNKIAKDDVMNIIRSHFKYAYHFRDEPQYFLDAIADDTGKKAREMIKRYEIEHGQFVPGFVMKQQYDVKA